MFVDGETPGLFYHWSELLPGTEFDLLGRRAYVVGFANGASERFVKGELPGAVIEGARSVSQSVSQSAGLIFVRTLAVAFVFKS